MDLFQALKEKNTNTAIFPASKKTTNQLVYRLVSFFKLILPLLMFNLGQTGNSWHYTRGPSATPGLWHLSWWRFFLPETTATLTTRHCLFQILIVCTDKAVIASPMRLPTEPALHLFRTIFHFGSFRPILCRGAGSPHVPWCRRHW